MNNINLEEKKKKKPYSSVTYTTGDIQKNIDHFNKMLSGKETNTHTDGYLNGTFKNSSAEKVAAKVGTFASQSPDGASSISTGGEASGAGEGGGCCESFINESGGKKGRKVTRYFIKPQNIWCAKKTDIINALIDNEDQDCTVYTLINLDDNKDITKLTNNDVIYYYKDGILFDKNMVRLMDYNLYVKHEEDRPKININTASDATIEKVYNDRLTGNMTEEFNELNLTFDDIDASGKVLKEAKIKEEIETCCICGEPIEGYGNNPYPVKNEGKCCNACNLHFVIPARLELLQKQK